MLVATLIYTFGTLAFLSFFIFWLSERHQEGRTHSYCSGSEHLIGGVFLLVCAAWFGLNFLETLADQGGRPSPVVDLMLLSVAFLLPPTMMHSLYVGNEATVAGFWKHGIGAVYFVSLVSILLAFGISLELLGARLMSSLVLLLNVLFMIAIGFLIHLSRRSRRGREGGREGMNRKWFAGLMSLMFLLIVAEVLRWNVFGSQAEVLLRSSPLYFLFASQYYHSRFGFFDVFVKRGGFFFIVLALLVSYFALVFPSVASLQLGWAAVWVYALTLLPVVLTLPWVYKRLGEWLDHAWLGRRYQPVEAVQFFLAGLREATTKRELIERAEQRLGDVFEAAVRVETGPASDDDFEAVEEVSFESESGGAGRIRMGSRRNDIPYFERDKALLGSIADVFSSMLDNVHLQDARQEQDRRARELSLQASRSELKALRAQINPHFLFNALNAIAGLIPRDPARAEETVEGLADIFRYTLSRSDKEWARLEDEMEFLRAYLEIEQARFGPRLEFTIEIDDDVRDARVPTMIVHTLVENAIKHGVAAVRGPGRIEVAACLSDGRLQIDVRDNGPGFDLPSEAEESSVPGYGLLNIRKRLNGYFGDAALLRARSDTTTGLTVVSVEMPATRVVRTA